MANSVYTINKGINKAIEFKGLKAQYIWYLAGGIIGVFLLFAIFYVIGINTFVCVGFFLAGTTATITYVFGLSHKYGQYGMMKKAARRGVPRVIRTTSRKIFFSKQ